MCSSSHTTMGNTFKSIGKFGNYAVTSNFLVQRHKWRFETIVPDTDSIVELLLSLPLTQLVCLVGEL